MKSRRLRLRLGIERRGAGGRGWARDAEDRTHAEAPLGAKWPKGTAKITDNQVALLAFFDFPAEHWIHLKTTNPIESTVAGGAPADQSHRRARLEGGGVGDGGQADRVRPQRWRSVNGSHLVALACAGAPFHNGLLVERAETAA
jgi:hypothetical protein